MKKVFLTIAIALLSHFIYAQNTFPSTGSAGIGTTAPTSSLTFGSTTTGIAAYNTADQTTNYEKVTQSWSGNIYSIGFTVGGTGTVRALQLGSANFVNTITLNAFRGVTFSTNSASVISGGHYAFEGVFNGAGLGSQAVVGIAPTITQTSTTGYTALFISPFENTLGTGTKYLIDAGTNTAAGGGAVTHTSKFRIDDTGNGYFLGNVGIGTTTPLTSLDIGGGVQISGTTSAAPSAGVVYGLFPYQGVGLGIYSAAMSSNQGIGIWTNPGGTPMEAIRILSGGNMLIGKTTQANSTYKLDVAGSVRANAITVNTTGADFVFEPTYKLFSLSEIEKYIQQNHHLPEIPSAKEMQTNGLNIGDNEIKLLQKVEELTLYIIEQNKRIEKLEAELNNKK